MVKKKTIPPSVINEIREGIHSRSMKVLKNREKERVQYNKDLRKRAKTYEELIVPVDCIVQKVTGYISSTSFQPRSERRYG